MHVVPHATTCVQGTYVGCSSKGIQWCWRTYLLRGEIKWLVVEWTGTLVEFRQSYDDFARFISYSSHLELLLSLYSAVQTWHICQTIQAHQQKTFPLGQIGCVRVDALHQSRQRHPGGGLLRDRREYHASRCTLPSDRSFAVSSSDSARAFSDAPESTCSYGGAFRTLRDLTIRIVKFWSNWDCCAALRETWCRILKAVVLRVP